MHSTTSARAPHATKVKRAAVRAALAAGGAVVALLLLEGFLQVVDPGRYGELEAREQLSAEILFRGADGVLRLRPGAQTSYLGKPVVIGAHGLRNPPVTMPKPADVYRVLVVGDSVPFGWGVGEDEAFPRRIERALQQRPRADGRRCEVINAGVPGFGLVEEYLWLRDQGLAWAPDAVLHVVIANDVDPLPAAPLLLLSPALRRVRTLRLLERLAERASAGEPQPGTGLTPEQVVVAVDRFGALCAEHRVAYALVDTIGMPALAAHCTARGIARIDCAVDVAWIDAHRVAIHDFHPDAAGHAWLAERVLAQWPW